MNLFKKLRTMKKYHFYAFHLLRETRILGWIRIKTENFITSVKYMEFTSKFVWGYFFFEFFFLLITEVYHFMLLWESKWMLEMKVFLSICLCFCLIAIISYVDNCQVMVPALDGKWKLLPILAFKITFAVCYLIIPFIPTGKFSSYNDL